MNWQHFIIAYLLLANVVTFFTYGIDKYKAKKGKWRISEAILLLMAIFGGLTLTDVTFGKMYKKRIY